MRYIAFVLSFFSLVIILEGTSCKHGNKYPKEAQMLDSMQIFVLKADSAVKTIDSVKVANCAHQIEKDDQLVQMMHGDSGMSPEAASIFRDLNSMRWALLTVIGKKGPLMMELGKSQKQLKHLSHDLQNNIVSADSVSYYVAFETKRASELIQVSNMSVSSLKNQLPMYDALIPKADSLISLLKAHKKF